jgi:hypothetical protein
MSILGKILKRVPFMDSHKDWLNIINANDLDYVYIRNLFLNSRFIRDLMKLKRMKSNIKILMEIPTYLYDKELSNRLCDIPIVAKEKFNRKRVLED